MKYSDDRCRSLVASFFRRHRPGRSIRLFLLALAVSSFSQAQAGGRIPSSSNTIHEDGQAGILTLRYDRPLLTAEVRDVPLARLMSALTQNAKLEVKLLDPSIGAEPVFADVHEAPLEKGIKKILRDFSYALYEKNQVLFVYILQANRGTMEPGGNWIGRMPDKETAMNQAADAMPYSLLEFNDPSGIGAVTADRIQPALDALRSEHLHLFPEALEQLAGSRDARAVEALSAAAQGHLGVTMDVQVRAAQALSALALSSGTADAEMAGVLHELESSNNDGVREVAARTLQSMR